MNSGFCGRAAFGDGKCIFHRENKTDIEADRFQADFPVELERLERSAGPMDFTGLVFPRPVNFTSHVFSKPVFFDRCIFENEAIFSEVTFREEACFREVKFRKGARFVEATFQEKADFSGAGFQEETHFEEAKFERHVILSHIILPQGPPNFSIYMENVRFPDPALVNFYKTNLSWFSFLGTDIRRLDLRDVMWYREKRRYIIAAELDLRKNLLRFQAGIPFHEYSPDDVAQAYRDLRANFEEHKRYAEAGNFFIGEMDAERMRPLYDDIWNSRFPISDLHRHAQSHDGAWRILYSVVARLRVNLSLHGIYMILGRYGESILRPISWSIVVITSFALLAGSELASIDRLPLEKLCHAFRNMILRNILLFFQMKEVTNLGDLCERLLGVLLLGIMFIAIRRRLERYR